MMYEYEVALSFAGEDGDSPKPLPPSLTKSGVNVFYDDYYAADLWGQDLSVKLREVYHSSSQFCIMIISEDYVKKMWPSHERQQAIERMIQQHGKAYNLPVRLDGYTGEVPGMSGAISYLAVSRSNTEVVVDVFLTKVGRKNGRTQQQKPAEPPHKPQFPGT